MVSALRIDWQHLASVEFRIADSRIVFATEAHASSETGRPQNAGRLLVGPPDRWPFGGDGPGGWQLPRDATEATIEVELPETEAAAIAIFEVAGAGAVYAVRDIDTGEVLWRASATTLPMPEKARLLLLTFEAPRRLRRLRLTVARASTALVAVDAVALLRAHRNASRRRAPGCRSPFSKAMCPEPARPSWPLPPISPTMDLASPGQAPVRSR